jgi:hypothetical protein
MPKGRAGSLYERLIVEIFRSRWKPGKTELAFDRSEIEEAARRLGVRLPRNIGDNIYSYRYRKHLPEEIASTAAPGRQWAIVGAGRAKYKFKQVMNSSIAPRENLVATKVPNATPEIVDRYALSDEQALLAQVRYNRWVDVFLRMAAYPLQSHLRSTVRDIGQIEIDEVYVGVDRSGTQFVVPVQAKGAKDRLGSIQTVQDSAFCRQRFPSLVCRPVSAQRMTDGTIAMFELTVDGDEVKVVEERHYRLVPADEISEKDMAEYRRRK